MRFQIILAGIFLLILASCGKMEQPVFQHIENVKLGTLGLKSSLMTFDMHYFNPNKRGGKLKEAEGDAWVDSSFVGHFRVDTLVVIPGKSNFVVPVKLDLDMKYLLKYTLTGFKNEDVLLTVKGTAKAGKGAIYKNIDINYEGKQNLAQMIK